MRYLLILLFLSSCTQSVLNYVKNSDIEPLFNYEEILLEAGLITKESIEEKAIPVNQTNYQRGTLKKSSTKQLEEEFKTVEHKENSLLTLTVNTKNYLIARPYFSSEDIIYNADNSTPATGKFIFLVGTKSGSIVIRLYHPETGNLEKSITYYVEILR